MISRIKSFRACLGMNIPKSSQLVHIYYSLRWECLKAISCVYTFEQKCLACFNILSWITWSWMCTVRGGSMIISNSVPLPALIFLLCPLIIYRGKDFPSMPHHPADTSWLMLPLALCFIIFYVHMVQQSSPTLYEDLIMCIENVRETERVQISITRHHPKRDSLTC